MNYDLGLNDVTFGLRKQPLVVELLTNSYDEPLTETKHKFCKYDAFSTTTKYEIKSRRCCYNTFLTTIIPVKVRNVTERLVFVFHFTDGLYYIVYDKDLFETFEQETITYHRTSGLNEPVLHFMIPIKHLTRIDI
jgi:hypothetical protein